MSPALVQHQLNFLLCALYEMLTNELCHNKQPSPPVTDTQQVKDTLVLLLQYLTVQRH